MNREPTNDKAAGLAGAGGFEGDADNRQHHAGNTAAAQRARLLDWLRRGPITTIEARRALDILMPAARVHELRALGFKILTHWVRQETTEGRLHLVALYSLASGGEQ
jgi:hypothetical protein